MVMVIITMGTRIRKINNFLSIGAYWPDALSFPHSNLIYKFIFQQRNIY
jgi:hypothetical protein